MFEAIFCPQHGLISLFFRPEGWLFLATFGRQLWGGARIALSRWVS